MKKTIIAVIIIVALVAIGYVVWGKTKPVMNPGSTFTGMSGLYTFSYEPTWQTYHRGEGGYEIDGVGTKDKTESMEVLVDSNDFVRGALVNGMEKESGSNVNGYAVDKYQISISTSTPKITLWVVNIPVSDKEKIDILFRFSSKKGDDGAEIIKTVKVNKTHSAEILTELHKAEARVLVGRTDIKIKGTIEAMKSFAEMYYKTAQSFAGICKDDSQLRISLKETGSAATSCKDSKTAYAVTAQLASQDYYCVDAAGAPKITKSLNTTTICSQ